MEFLDSLGQPCRWLFIQILQIRTQLQVSSLGSTAKLAEIQISESMFLSLNRTASPKATVLWQITLQISSFLTQAGALEIPASPSTPEQVQVLFL